MKKAVKIEKQRARLELQHSTKKIGPAVALLFSLYACLVDESISSKNLTCNPSVYVKLSEIETKDGKNTKRNSIMGANDRFAAACGVDVIVKAVDGKNENVSYTIGNPRPDSILLNFNNQESIVCESGEVKSEITFGPVGYRIASITLQIATDSITLKEMEKKEINDKRAGWLSVIFERGLRTKDGELVFQLSVTSMESGKSRKYTISMPEGNLFLSQRDVIIPDTEITVTDFEIC